MRILLASSEVVPFSKTGGLADVAAALPKALAQLGHDVSVVVPNYPQVQKQLLGSGPPVTTTGQVISVPVGAHDIQAQVFRSHLPDSRVSVYLIDQPNYFDRATLYGDRHGDFGDNCARFVFFSRAVLELAKSFDRPVDIVHANDWQTALIPVLLKTDYRDVPEFERTASIFTIHNMAFQGQFWHWDMLLTGLDWKYFNWRQLEFFGNLNLLKAGIVFSDLITTVSPTYAREIQTPEFGYGLHGVLSGRRDDLVGILNGCDTAIWNPRTDPHLPVHYDDTTFPEGKAAAKAALQQRLNLPLRPDLPILGMISRMTSQKGFDLIAESIPQLLRFDAQYVFLGNGDPGYEDLMRRFANDAPEQLSVTIGYDEPLSHLIEAASDIFLMPSQFEPCGLNQMYSLIYGTPPIVRAVGGLADSVVDASPDNLRDGIANGFSFFDYRGDVLVDQVRRALAMRKDSSVWQQLVQTGMQRDWSWRHSANEYRNVYERALWKRMEAPALAHV